VNTASAVVKTSRFSYAETVQKLTDAIRAKGNTVFASIDQAAAAQGVGLTLRPTTLVLFGNPKGGTGLMQAFPLIALDLPLKLLVWEESGGVKVAYVPMAAVAARYDVTGQDEKLGAMDQALNALTDTVV